MKKLFILLSSVCLLAACSSSKKTTKTATDNTVSTVPITTPPPVSIKTEKDGSTFDKAIFINETTETKGIDAEYAWIKNHYSGYSINGQALKMNGSKPYDVINISTAEGKKLDLYFDISNFYGK
jgi:uncharacterized protein YcfL